MELPLDLTSPRPNPDIGVTIRAIQSHVKHIAAEKDPVARRGHAFVLIEQLNHLVESPDPLPPLLQEGTVDDPDDWLADELLASSGVSLLKTRPFGIPVSSPGHFFVEFNGRLSALFKELPPDGGPLGFPGPWVFVHRLEHTTTTRTSRFLEGAEGLARVAKMVRLNAAGPRSSGALLLIDPRGYSRSRGAVPAALVLGAKEGVAEMITLADDLSAGLGIRLAVTTLARLIDSH